MVLLLLNQPLITQLNSILNQLPKELSDSIEFQLSNSNESNQEEGEEGEEGRLEGDRVKTIPHELLVKVSEWSKLKKKGSKQSYRLSNLLKLTDVYAPPLKPREKSAELLAILSKIQQEQDVQSYHTMTSNTPYSHTMSLLPLNDIHDSVESRGFKSEQEEWKEIKKQLSSIFNVLVSMLAVGVAVWWVGGGRSYAQRFLLSFSGSIAIGLIEGFLYWRIFSSSEESTSSKKSSSGKVLKFETLSKKLD